MSGHLNNGGGYIGREEFEDTKFKGVIRSRKSKDRQYQYEPH